MICIVYSGCTDRIIRKIEKNNFKEFEFKENAYPIEVIEFYPFEGNKITSRNWSNLYLCKETLNQDTILLFEIEKKASKHIYERNSFEFRILIKDKEKCPDEIIVTYPDSLKLSKSYKILCAKLRYMLE